MTLRGNCETKQRLLRLCGRSLIRWTNKSCSLSAACRICHDEEEEENRIRLRVKYWELIADNLSKAAWTWGCVSAVDREGRTIWIADAHRDDGKRFVVRAERKADRVSGIGISYSRL